MYLMRIQDNNEKVCENMKHKGCVDSPKPFFLCSLLLSFFQTCKQEVK
jgi:hypothetical protein